jgi:aldose 1-epimerase
MPEAPSGDIVLRAGGAQALLRPAAGGRVCSLRLEAPGGDVVPVLFAYEPADVDPLRWAKGGIYPLLPYSNRIAQARLHTPQGAVGLSPHPDAHPHTLHGNAHGMPWQASQTLEAQATMTLESAPCAAWPWRYQAWQRLHLEPTALRLELGIVNRDERPMPAGLGWHPYLLHRLQARIGLSATTLWPTTDDFLATHARPLRPDEGYVPPRALRPGTLTDYLSGWDGQLDVDLPGGAVLSMQADEAVSHLVLHRPPDGRYLCVEPVTHVADGFNLEARGLAGTGTRWLAAGQSLRATLCLRLQAAAPESSS